MQGAIRKYSTVTRRLWPGDLIPPCFTNITNSEILIVKVGGLNSYA